MKLGIICSYEHEKTYETVKGLGLDGMEFTINHNIDSEKFLADVPTIKERLEKHGLLCLSTGRWGMKRVDDDGNIIPEALQHDKNVILGASKLGCPVFNCGCNYANGRTLKENYDIAIDCFSKLIEYGKELGVKYNILEQEEYSLPVAQSIALCAKNLEKMFK